MKIRKLKKKTRNPKVVDSTGIFKLKNTYQLLSCKFLLNI